MKFDSYVVQDTNLSFTIPLGNQTPKISYTKLLKGFTLAEVLITLTIIGVIAAMTVPTLLMNHQKQTFAVGAKKAYAMLSNALKMLPIERGCPAGDYECTGYNTQETMDGAYNFDGKTYTNSRYVETYLLSTVLKTQKICTGNAADCGMFNSYDTFKNDNFGQIILDNGMVMAVGSSKVRVDVNGSKGPNKDGRDVFSFFLVTSNNYGVPRGTVVPYGSKLHDQYWRTNNRCQNGAIDETCTGRVLEEGAMNY